MASRARSHTSRRVTFAANGDTLPAGSASSNKPAAAASGAATPTRSASQRAAWSSGAPPATTNMSCIRRAADGGRVNSGVGNLGSVVAAGHTPRWPSAALRSVRDSRVLIVASTRRAASNASSAPSTSARSAMPTPWLCAAGARVPHQVVDTIPARLPPTCVFGAALVQMV